LQVLWEGDVRRLRASSGALGRLRKRALLQEVREKKRQLVVMRLAVRCEPLHADMLRVGPWLGNVCCMMAKVSRSSCLKRINGIPSLLHKNLNTVSSGIRRDNLTGLNIAHSVEMPFSKYVNVLACLPDSTR
jgi:hypothetical protein